MPKVCHLSHFIFWTLFSSIPLFRTKKFVSRARHDNSTSNLNDHIKHCSPQTPSNNQSIASFAHGSTYTPDRLRYKVVELVTVGHRPFSIIEDKALLDIFAMLDSRTKDKVHGRHTVSRDVKDVYQMSKKNVARILQVRLFFFLLR